MLLIQIPTEMYSFCFSHFECFGSEEIGTVKGKNHKKENVSIMNIINITVVFI